MKNEDGTATSPFSHTPFAGMTAQRIIGTSKTTAWAITTMTIIAQADRGPYR
ncbi:MAG: hypothetical protein Q8K57_16360 [Thiobacillus sp.]|nr:hypothetical protein [Thiobacillus sp.]